MYYTLKLLIILLLQLLIACANSPQSLDSRADVSNGIETEDSQYFIKVANKHQANKILFIGDSHAIGLFGRELFSRLQTKYPATELYFYAVCGSSPSWWVNGHETKCGYWQLDFSGHEIKTIQAPTPDLNVLLHTIKPSLIIVEQGTNLIKFNSADVKQEVTQLIDFIKAITPAKIVWVGPPDARAYSKKAIKSTFLSISEVCTVQRPKIALIDSRRLTRYPKSAKDGIHYNGIEGQIQHTKWANEVAKVINFK